VGQHNLVSAAVTRMQAVILRSQRVYDVSSNMLDSEILSINGLRHHRAWVVGIFGVALLLRLAMLSFTFQGNDAVNYFDDAQIALNLIEGRGYSLDYGYRNWLLYAAVLKTAELQDPVTEGTRTTANKQPVYALLLAGLFYCFGPKNFLVVFLLHAIISSFTVSLLFLCLRQTAPFSALAIAFATTIYPPFIFHSVTVPESTTLLLLLIAALWLCLIKIRDRASWGLWVIGGAIGGLTVLTEPVMLPFVGICFFYEAYLDHRSLRNRLAAFVMATAVALLVLSPWLMRNYLVFERFPVLKSGALGHTFNLGLHVSGKGSWISDERMVALEKAGRNLSELEEEEAIARELRSMFPSHWRQYVTYDIPYHFLHFWWDVPRYWNDYSVRYLVGKRIPYLLLLGLALPQLFLTMVRLVRQPLATLDSAVLEVSALVLIVTVTVPYSLIGSFNSRYRFPVELGLFIFAGTTLRPAVESVWKRWVCPSPEST
jgi:hypothetical protein